MNLKTASRRWQQWITSCKNFLTWLRKPYLACRTSAHRKLPAWRLEIVLGITLATIALILNCTYLGLSLRRNPSPNGLGIFGTGTCQEINRWNKFCHGVINVASTLLLQQSNTIMQILASPYRHEVDSAHKEHEWLDIGIPSMRNIWKRSIALERVVMWWLIAFSSLPLHLLWNSVLVSSPRAFSYLQLAVDQRFVSDTASFDAKRDIPGLSGSPIAFTGTDEGGLYPDNLATVQASVNNTEIWEMLDSDQCAQSYMQNFLRDRSDVIVVMNTTTALRNQASVFGAAYAGMGPWPYSWLCSEEPESFACRSKVLHNNEPWTLDLLGLTLKPDHCLSKRMDDLCTLEYAWIVTILVICANAFKFLCFLYAYVLLRRVERGNDGKRSRLLLTNEDAIASFLEHNDEETEGMCLAEKKDFENGLWSFLGVWFEIRPRKWFERKRKSWFRAVGKWRWLALMTLMFAMFSVPVAFLLASIPYYKSLGLSGIRIWQFGIGNTVGQFLIGGQRNANFNSKMTTINDVIYANLPQLLISIIQFWWTTQMTTMLAAREYGKFASISRELRVSYTEGSGSIGLPWRYRILNFALWTIIPWLASQAVFFAKIDVVDHWLYPTRFSISQVGYSVLGLIFFALASFAAFALGLRLGVRRLPNGIPLAGTCSAAISAACHPHDRSIGHHEREVRWGVETTHGGDPIYRCTFTSSDGVGEPSEFDVAGHRKLYA